ncbi:hypothetical protein [Methylobacter sp.]|uniref:hypothetical protein n=1 Tax=Methylobacter sp. TaxID=2051955 RepID=UPI0012158F6D|nr:hypothetical protein [Methylobacter sp.]TAK59540.1 MAG: hypothetical protein EPO18_20475 [Methylobacter sp.]
MNPEQIADAVIKATPGIIAQAVRAEIVSDVVGILFGLTLGGLGWGLVKNRYGGSDAEEARMMRSVGGWVMIVVAMLFGFIALSQLLETAVAPQVMGVKYILSAVKR